jgi:hypothetical protein
MVIYDVSLSECKRFAEELGIVFVGHEKYTTKDGRVRIQGSLKPKGKPHPNPYQKTSASYFNQGRKVHGVCWHGYRDWMRALFTAYPTARITTGRIGKIDYNGLDGFEANYVDTGFINVGAQICPINACEACSCKDSGYAY